MNRRFVTGVTWVEGECGMAPGRAKKARCATSTHQRRVLQQLDMPQGMGVSGLDLTAPTCSTRWRRQRQGARRAPAEGAQPEPPESSLGRAVQCAELVASGSRRYARSACPTGLRASRAGLAGGAAWAHLQHERVCLLGRRIATRWCRHWQSGGLAVDGGGMQKVPLGPR